MNNIWVEISKSALLHNIASIKTIIQPWVKLMAVVKANAYGHGLTQVGEIAADYTDGLAVINLDEARLLRQKEIHAPILVLGYTSEQENDIVWAINERIEIVVNSLTHAQRLSKIIENSSSGSGSLRVHIKIDTGMGRMGILAQNAVDYIKQISELPNISIKGIMSHFADVVDHKEYAQKQLQRFEDIKFQLYRESIQDNSSSVAGAQDWMWHIAKTEAILDFPQSHLDAVRLGIGLYGLWPNIKLIDRVHALHPEFELKPVLSWKTRILQVKDYPEGEYVGYGCTHKTHRQTRIAILPAGYYEGYDRGLSNKGDVLIGGKRCPIIGRICMNMCMVDATGVKEVKRGDEAVLIGAQGREYISADEIAKKIDTVHYEVVARINPKIERIITE